MLMVNMLVWCYNVDNYCFNRFMCKGQIKCLQDQKAHNKQIYFEKYLEFNEKILFHLSIE